MPPHASYSPIEVATALSLYGYNVSPLERAQKLFDHFEGYCADLEDLMPQMVMYGSASTGLAYPTALLYVQHALDKYGEEAVKRCHTNHKIASSGE